MLDTLKLTKRLEDAGVERRIAEAMAEAFAEGTIETVATKQDLREESAALRAEMRSESAALRSEMQTFRWQVIAAVALLLLIHLGGVWGIVAAHTP